MINTYNLNKNYNSLNVIDNITLSLPSKGLVTLLGRSGCGKTTLLNVLGGLDSFKSGIINYQNIEFNKYKMDNIDNYRKYNFGYIFQNYNILENKTVYDNLLLALHIIGIYDKDECDKRIKNALTAVDMYKFRKKLAGALSGGQMQRISIARCLIKKNKLIIADEPTGNLDSETSCQIMRILKKISKNSLVLFVTHNKDLAYTYSDVLYTLKDGKIETKEELDNSVIYENKSLNDVYLQDLNKNTLSSDNINVNLYSNNNDKLDISIIEHNGIYYLKSSKKISLDYNMLKLHNESYEKKATKEEKFDYSDSDYEDIKTNRKKQIFTTFKEEFISFFGGKRKTKLFKLAFILVGVIFFICNLFLISQDKDYSDGCNYLSDVYSYYLYDDSNSLELLNSTFIENLSYEYDDYVTLRVYKNFTVSDYLRIGLNVYNESILKDENIIIGRRPLNSKEYVVSLSCANTILELYESSNLETVLGIELGSYKDLGSICIVGVSYDEVDIAYRCFDDEKVDFHFGNVSSNIYSIDYMNDNNINLIEGILPVNNTDIVITSDLSKLYNVKLYDNISSYKVVGIAEDSQNRIFANRDLVTYLKGLNDDEKITFTIKNDDLYDIIIEDYLFNDYYDYIENAKYDFSSERNGYIVLTIVLLVICGIYTFFTMKSKMLQDIYQIGVERELGRKRSSIIFIYIVKSFVTVTLTMVIGYIISTVIYSYIAIKLNSFDMSMTLLHNNITTYLMLLLMYIVGIFFGILPVLTLLRKTPAQIVAKYDI